VTAWTGPPSRAPRTCPTPSPTSPSTTASTTRPCRWASGAPSASSQNAWITECFLDELAAAGGQDPLALRRRLLKDQPRHLGVLNLAAEQGRLGCRRYAGRYRGIAVAESFGSYVAQVAEVSIDDGQVRVHARGLRGGLRPCGQPGHRRCTDGERHRLRPHGHAEERHQHRARGASKQGNFDDFPLLRMSEMPAIEVHILPAEESPAASASRACRPSRPAVCNAVFAATGKPVARAAHPALSRWATAGGVRHRRADTP
jgi:isoquinoline 1-oxidoreductase beta subunit